MSKILGVPVDDIISPTPLSLYAQRFVSQTRDAYGVTTKSQAYDSTHSYTIYECSPYAKAAAELAFIATAIASTLETLISAITFLFLRCIKVCVPYKAGFEKNVLIPVRNYTINSFLTTNVGFVNLFENFRCAKTVQEFSEGDITAFYTTESE